MKEFLPEEGSNLEARLLQSRVQGSLSQWSINLDQGAPRLNMDGVPAQAEPDLEFLAEYLRSSRPMTDDIRNWLADLMDPNSDCDYQFKKLSLRKPKGRKKLGISPHWDAAEYALSIWVGSEVNNQMEFDEIPEGMFEYSGKAVEHTARKFGISIKSLEAAITEYRKAKREHDRISRLEWEYQQDQKRDGTP